MRRASVHKRLALLLVLVLAFSTTGGVFAYDDFDGSQSGWAEPELSEAYDYGLTYPDVMEDFTRNITREEFCTLAVKLYEALTGLQAQTGEDPFEDTDNPEILKAYALGIVNGVSATSFAPQNNITRQEICVMIFRALKASLPGLDTDISGDFPFSDQDRIASWAMEAMRFAYKNGIMKGMGEGLIGPLSNTTREQAIVLLKRTYAAHASGGAETEAAGTIPVYAVSPLVQDQRTKYHLMGTDSLAFPAYDQRLKLYAASGVDRPSVKPSTGTFLFQVKPIYSLTLADASTYLDASYGIFVDKAADTSRWFAYTLSGASGADKVVWQVASSPFSGGKENWRAPTGLLGTGQVAASAGEFEIDFDNLSTGPVLTFTRRIFSLSTAEYKPIPQARTHLYVRAVPVDASGSPIGDPGTGMAVLYGEKAPEQAPDVALAKTFELWTPLSSTGKFSGENQDRPYLRPMIRIDPRAGENRFFHFHGLDAGVDRISIQVSSEPFPDSGGWPDTPNLMYEKTYDLPTFSYVADYPSSVFVDFTEFGKPAEEMAEGAYVKYYLRGVALTDSDSPGLVTAACSDTVTVEYGYSAPLAWYSDSPYKRTQTLDAALPSLSIQRYVPADWQDKDCLQRYYVYRAPKAGEIMSNWKNSATGETLYPYWTHIAYYANKGINSASEYESKMIPRVLPEGAKVYFPEPKEEDKAWYQQLYDGIVEFFEDLAAITKALVNQVGAAYADLKTNLVAYVADLCPIDSLKGPFRTALEGLVNYGLMSVGIPPTLPTFDQLSDMSADYLAEVALTEAGVPATDMTKDVVRDVADGIREEMAKAASYADKNPVDAPFLKLDPDALYRPAYVDVAISNNTGKPSVPGSFDLGVTFEMTYYNKLDPKYPLSLDVPTNYAYGSDAGLTTALGYREHFERGLNGFAVDYAFSGDTAVYDVFNPQAGIKVPALRPYSTRMVRVYLNPFDGPRFSRYPEGEHVLAIDFENMYFNNGAKKFTFFTLAGRFPTAEEYLAETGTMVYLDPETDYVFTSEHMSDTYDRVQRPVSASWSK